MSEDDQDRRKEEALRSGNRALESDRKCLEVWNGRDYREKNTQQRRENPSCEARDREAWECFAGSGRVQDYLRYCHHESELG